MTLPSHGAYRPDIDGLRAIAVLGVILFHAGNPLVAGGYVGVDVFFVISGYLITGILKRELAGGTFSFARFYERRARRILPALFVVLAVTLAAGLALMLRSDAQVVGRSAIAVLLFSANVLFWRGLVPRTDNYFADPLHEQPLLHTWSLGVEEQYYLLFPIALFAIWRMRPAWVLPALIAGTAASFAWCAWLTPRDAPAAFYLLPTRMWQLLVGGVLAVTGSERGALRRDVHELLALAGLALIVIPMAQYDSTTTYPGVYAAAPVLGTALLIAYAPASGVGRLLASTPLVFIGVISYSAYLWHQPLFALARYTSATTELGAVRALLLCAGTLLLAAATWRWVETPFRDRRRTPVSTVIWAGVAGVVIIGVLSVPDVLRGTTISPRVAAQMLFSMFNTCYSGAQGRWRSGCLLDPSSTAPPTFLVVGDSHAGAMVPAFERASRLTGRQGRLLQLTGCSPLFTDSDGYLATPSCLALLTASREMIADRRIDSVFLVARWDYNYVPRAEFASRLKDVIAAYAEYGATVRIVKQTPEQARFSKRAYVSALLRHRFLGEDLSATIAQQSISIAEHRQTNAFADGIFETLDQSQVELVDFTRVLCDAERCAVGTDSDAFYADDDHLSRSGALLVSDVIAASLQRPN